MFNVVLFGPPGAGKGTQAELIIKKWGFVHFSTGDMLRSEIKAKSELGLLAQKTIEKGELVSDELVIKLIENKIDQNRNAVGFIFDGFPRTIAQAESLDGILNSRNIPISTMISLEVPKNDLIARLLLRGKDSGRADDQNESVIENRINVYNKETSPVINFYKAQNKCVEIKGVGTIEEIFNSIVVAVEARMK